MPKTMIFGTAGHIDHGKSALVRSLTGIDPDRLKEEKERGITIDIGFASLALMPDLLIGLIDVPGHERFIKNMLAGVGGIDAVLLVIAADEGIMPQTREHFDICQLLQIQAGLVVLTKTDLVEREWLDLVKLEIQDYLQGSFMQGASIIPVSSLTGAGMEHLKNAMAELAGRIQVKSLEGTFRLPVDRCFTLHGHGTIVTGTLLSGYLKREDEVEIYPLGKTCRIRNLQVHSIQMAEAHAGQRTAVNLQGIEVAEVQRGMVLASPERYLPVRTVDVHLRLLPESPLLLKPRTRARFHQGTSEHMARITPLEKKEVLPGENGLARIHLDSPLLMLPGDRFILRRFSPMLTFGGGEILDISPLKRGRDLPRQLRFLKNVLNGFGPEYILEMAQRNGRKGLTGKEVFRVSTWNKEKIIQAVQRLADNGHVKILSLDPLFILETSAFQSLQRELIDYLNNYHHLNPLSSGISKEQLASALFPESSLLFKTILDTMVKNQQVVLEREEVRLKGKGALLSDKESRAKEQMESTFLRTGFQMPSLEELFVTLQISPEQGKRLLILLAREKKVLKIAEGLYCHVEMLEKLKKIMADQKRGSSQIDVSLFKTLTGVSRKYAIPLLEYLDREKITRRAGEHRVIL
jgi:selenocysteine-specific elongation factor